MPKDATLLRKQAGMEQHRMVLLFLDGDAASTWTPNPDHACSLQIMGSANPRKVRVPELLAHL